MFRGIGDCIVLLEKLRMKKCFAILALVLLFICCFSKPQAMRLTSQDCEEFMYEHYVVFEESFKKELCKKCIALGFYIRYLQALGSVVPPGHLPTIGDEVAKAWEFSEENSEDFIANLLVMEKTLVGIYNCYHRSGND